MRNGNSSRNRRAHTPDSERFPSREAEDLPLRFGSAVAAGFMAPLSNGRHSPETLGVGRSLPQANRFGRRLRRAGLLGGQRRPTVAG